MSAALAAVPEPTRVERILPEHLVDGALSVVVFGPGRGEAVVVQLPDGRLGVVDGCKGPSNPKDPRGTGDPVREFLHAVEAHRGLTEHTLELEFVCLTHPHDDHYAGLGQLMSRYSGRIRRPWTGPHGGRYAKALMAYIGKTRGGRDSLPDNADLKGLEAVILEFANARRRCRLEFDEVRRGAMLLPPEDVAGHPLTITGWGPAPADSHAALEDLYFALTELTQGMRPPRPRNPNLTSGALLVRWGTSAVLLAGDLLRGRGGTVGWEAAHGLVDGPVQVVNVAHHASEEAHDEELWRKMAPALAIITPFKNAMTDKRGTRYPPRPDDVKRLAETSVVAITARPRWAEGSLRLLSGNGVLPIQTGGRADDIHNAVAVSLDAEGRVSRLVLGGKADLYP